MRTLMVCVLLLACCFSACKTPRKTEQSLERHAEYRHDSVSVYNQWMNLLLKADMNLQLHNITLTLPVAGDSVTPPQAAKIYIEQATVAAQIEQHTQIETKDSTTTKKQNNETEKAETKTASDPLRWRYIFGILVIIAGIIYYMRR